ncbi:hypothetical protein WR25_23321 [Diploscapter pachys]|uniref:SAM domain-containing protein n=1 Tax=Diploscapter pachys TaxID=2018661 RepID=A0A2A2J7X0_9BILA|nr:hypothetical protein WR25_23321 [Diploscapter pachys]
MLRRNDSSNRKSAVCQPSNQSNGNNSSYHSLPRKKAADFMPEFFRSATMRPKKNRQTVATIHRLSVASMSSRIASLPSSTPGMPREAKKFNLPQVPVTMINGPAKRVDSNQNLPVGYRPPSNLSDFSSNDSQNGNMGANVPGNRRSNNNLTSFNCYGTNTGALLLGPQKTGVASLSAASLMSASFPLPLPSSSSIPSPSSAAGLQPPAAAPGPVQSGENGTTLLPTSPLQHHRVSTGSNSSYGSSGFESMKCSASASSSTSSFVPSRSNPPHSSDVTPNRTSDQSSAGSGSSSLASTSVHTLDDSVLSSSYAGDASAASTPSAAINVTQLVAKGVPEAEILANWLDSIHMIEYLSLFLTQGYDLSSIARITPEDLLALGIKNPDHRRRLIYEIHTWQITDSWPSVIPTGGLREWLAAIALNEYVSVFESQGYRTVQDLISLNWEDFEDIGVKRLGHLKRLGLAVKKIMDHRRALARGDVDSTLRTPQSPSVQIVHSPLLQPRVLHHSHTNGHFPTSKSGPSQTPQPHRTSSLFERMNDPPPPAPSTGANSVNSLSPLNDNIDYISYTRGSKATNNYRAQPENAYAQIDKQRHRVQSSICDSIGSDDQHTIRLNLIPTAKILSEVEEKDEDGIDGASVSGDYADVPPPPAPLFCNEGSYRLMQRSLRPFTSQPSTSVAIPGLSIPSSSSADSSTLSLEQLPFANENFDTIKSRGSASAREPLEQPKSVPNMASGGRKSLSNIYQKDSHQTSLPTSSSHAQNGIPLRLPQAVNGNSTGSGTNVLTDIGFMLQNLTDELDAMMLVSKQQKAEMMRQQTQTKTKQ